MPDFCDFGDWEVPVENLSKIKQPNRDHAYILPDNSIWVLSHDGKNFIQINLGEGSGDSQPTQIENNDGFISVDRSGTYDVSVDLDMKKVTETLKPEFQVSKITADDGSAELVVTAPETILGKVVTAGAGFKTGFANPAVADAPTADGEIRFLSSMIQSDGGSVIALDKSGNVYSRMISSNKYPPQIGDSLLELIWLK